MFSIWLSLHILLEGEVAGKGGETREASVSLPTKSKNLAQPVSGARIVVAPTLGLSLYCGTCMFTQKFPLGGTVPFYCIHS